MVSYDRSGWRHSRSSRGRAWSHQHGCSSAACVVTSAWLGHPRACVTTSAWMQLRSIRHHVSVAEAPAGVRRHVSVDAALQACVVRECDRWRPPVPWRGSDAYPEVAGLRCVGLEWASSGTCEGRAAEGNRRAAALGTAPKEQAARPVGLGGPRVAPQTQGGRSVPVTAQAWVQVPGYALGHIGEAPSMSLSLELTERM